MSEHPGSRTETPSGEFSREVSVEWAGQHPTRIGHYRIVDLLGVGGMGAVYLAEQVRPVQRRVAIKVLATELRGTSAEVRFQSEAKSMARLSHSGIAHLYAAGITDGGQSFMVMEVVDGPPITEYCDQNHLSLEQRLVLFRQVCDAVQYAHQKALIHRDLNPNNVLIKVESQQPTPKIIDFGIAKGLDAPLAKDRKLTQGLIGTPLYLSPEAILNTSDEPADTADVRIDVYALGMLLYKLLVGLLPLEQEGANMVRTIRRALEEDQPAPEQYFAGLPAQQKAHLAARLGLGASTLQRRLRGDLSWIVAKAIQREREQRYPSVEALASDISRYLQQDAVSVAPPSRRYRLGKFFQRHRRFGLVAGGFLLALLGLLLFALLLAQQDRQRTERSETRAREAEQEAAFLAQLVTRSASETTSTLPRETSVDADNAASSGDWLDQGVARLREREDAPPEVRARLLQTLAVAYGSRGDRRQAESLLFEALDLRRGHYGESHPRVAEPMLHLAFLRWRSGNAQEADQLFRSVLDIRRQAANGATVDALLDTLVEDLVTAYGLEPSEAQQLRTVLREAGAQ